MSREKVQSECQEIRTLPDGVGRVLQWIQVKKAFAKFQAARGNETSDNKGSDDTTSKTAERKRKLDASPVEFYCRSKAGVACGILLLTCQKL